ncbi:MAG: MalM family protein [Gammaproteobacteria bacterium]|nr:MalM family protein [Gammaproteobacteria bacterium]MDH5727881.1 MalM family protein [Gammaproteobacteria bacterium]
MLDVSETEKSTPAYFFELPVFDKRKKINLASLVRNNQFYYPVVLLLTSDFAIDKVVRKDVVFDKDFFHGFNINYDFEVKPTHRYLVITTASNSLGKTVNHIFETQNEQMIFLPGGGFFT